MVRRRTILETDDPEVVLEAGFSKRDGTPDLSVSTYEIESARLIQTRCEHCAGSGLDRPDRCGTVDLADLHDNPIPTDANEWFRYANDAHRELRFRDRDDLLAFIRKLVLARDGRSGEIAAAGCAAYVKQMHGSSDPEWMRFFSGHEKGPRWLQRVVGT